MIRISIATKLILLTLILVLVVAVPLAYQSSRYFEDSSRKKEEESNQSQAVFRASETESILQSLLDKSRSIGTLFLTQQQQANGQELLSSIETLLDNDRDIFALDIYKVTNGEYVLEKSLIKKKQFEKIGLDEVRLQAIREKNPFPLSSVAQGQIEIMPVVGDLSVPLMAFGIPLSRNDLGQINGITVAYFQLGRVQRAFSQKSESQIFLVDSRGRILAHPDEKVVLEGRTAAENPVVLKALSNASPRLQMAFEDSQGHQAMQGAYAKTAMGPIVISQISLDDILRPARQARRQSILIAGTTLSIALFLVFLLSMTFSAPIETLAGFIKEVSKGNLNVTAKSKIKSRDELGLLANAFDDMVSGLRERAKAYAVMNQALGASVVQTLMMMKEEELGGQRKPVSVLFSDLRDFTKFSDGHTPEEVVSMLNEYFDVMVKVVEANGGWLDKFIGDAIMAVWGVPYTGDDDSGHAVKAALEMRIALQELNVRRMSRGQSPIKIGIGLHCGDAIVGKIGSAERANLTVIGDTVNQASRIEASTKAFGTDILLSQEIANKLGERFAFEFAGKAEVKGKSEALSMFKIRGFIDEHGEEIEVITQWSEYEASAVDKIKVA